MGRTKGNFQAWLITIAIALVLAANNIGCSEVRLAKFKANRSNSRLVGGVDTTLPLPIINPNPMRVIFFVDQSYSMLRARCPQDLDNPKEDEISNTGDIRNCSYEPGIDPEAHRYQAIEKWLGELTDYMKGDIDTDKVKVAIIPFSGGKFERPSVLLNDNINDFKFKNLRESKEWLIRLKQEHEKDLNNAKSNWSPQTMGTTVPLRTLEFANSTLMTEIQKLKSQNPDELKITPIHFIYLTDGVYKPIDGYLQKAQRLIGCKDCNDPANRDHPSCVPPSNVCTGGECPYTYCHYTVPKEFRLAFGDPARNNTDLLASQMKNMTAYQERFETGPVNISLVKLHPDRIKEEDKNSPTDNGIKNIFDIIYQKVPKSRKYALNDGEPPFSLVGGGAFLSYRLDEFYAVNLNAYVSANGKFVTDSDGDGISDDEEKLLGSNPQKYRSDGNLCADGIKKNYGCRAFGCTHDYDEDGDGLGECEENSFDSKSEHIDNDQDNILDYFESIRFLNPQDSEADKFTAGERYSDLMHFYAGVHPKWPISKTPVSQMVDIKIVELGYENVSTSGTPVSVAKYQIKINNIPLKKTLAAQGMPKMKRDPKSSEVIPDYEIVGPTDHPANTNQIVMLARVVANENPEIKYWLMYKKEVSVKRDDDTFSFDVDFSKFHQLNLLEGEK